MKLLEVNTPKLAKAWINMPRRIYKDDPVWISPLKQDLERIFDPKRNKAFRYGSAIRWLLVDDTETPIGRVAAFVNEKHQNPSDYPVGGMGFFDCIHDQEAANLLFDQCKGWLEQQGVEAMDGPINFGEKTEFWGLLIQNFMDPPTYAFNYNQPYYIELFENYGFKTFYEQLVFHRSMKEPADEVFVRKANKLKDKNIRVSNVQGYSLSRIADEFLEVYNKAWSGHDGFKAMTGETAHKLIQSMKPVMDRRIGIFAYDGDTPIGMAFCIPELNQVFRHVNGNLNWWGKLKYLWHSRINPPRTMYGLVWGVVPEWQGQGVEGALVVHLSDTVGKAGLYDDIVITWVGDFNPKMIHVSENLGATVKRKYATMRYLFDQNRPFERHPVIGAHK